MTALVTYWALLVPPEAVQSPLSVPPPQATKVSGMSETRLKPKTAKIERFMFTPRCRFEAAVITELRVWTPAFRLQRLLMGSDGFTWSGSLDETDIQSLY